MEAGSQFSTKKSGVCTVIEYIDSRNIVVEFQDGYRKVCQANSLKKGNIKNPYYPSVQGVGFLGEGPYITSKDKVLTQESITWRGMLQRCYDTKFLLKHPTYEGNYTSTHFNNFQNFAHWCQSSVGFNNKSWCLDKDIILRGNKEYSQDSCAFVPHEINNLLISSKICRGEMPIGVSYHKDKRMYSASCHRNGKQVEIGMYLDPLEAFESYKAFKESNIKAVANKWRGQVDDRVYESLMQWEVNLGD